jgi:hypothetical protein
VRINLGKKAQGNLYHFGAHFKKNANRIANHVLVDEIAIMTNESVEKRIEFLMKLKNILGNTVPELTKGIDAKIKILNYVSHNKDFLRHVIECYKSIIEFACQGDHNSNSRKLVDFYSEKLNAKYNGENKKEFMKLAKQTKTICFEAMNKLGCSDVLQTFNRDKNIRILEY